MLNYLKTPSHYNALALDNSDLKINVTSVSIILRIDQRISLPTNSGFETL